MTASERDFPCCNTPTPATGHPAPITGDDYARTVWRDRGERIAALEAENAELRFDLDAERQQYVELRAELADATTAAQNLRDELQAAQEENGRLRRLAERVITVHEQVVMDTAEDRDLHARACSTFRAALEAKKPSHSATAANCREGDGLPISSGLVCNACQSLEDDDPAWLHRPKVQP